MIKVDFSLLLQCRAALLNDSHPQCDTVIANTPQEKEMCGLLQRKLKMASITSPRSLLTRKHWNGPSQVQAMLGNVVFFHVPRKEANLYLPVSDRKYCPSSYSPYRWRTKPSLNRDHMINEFLAVTKMQVGRLPEQHRDSDFQALVVLRIELVAWIKLCQVLMHCVQLVTTRPTQHRCL